MIPERLRTMSDEEYREVLVQRMEEIDQNKRAIQAQIHSASNRAKESRTHIDQHWLRRAKDAMRHMTSEREEMRCLLGDLNARIKEERRKRNGLPAHNLAAEFMLVAQEHLPEEVFDAIRDQAAWRLANAQKGDHGAMRRRHC